MSKPANHYRAYAHGHGHDGWGVPVHVLTQKPNGETS